MPRKLLSWSIELMTRGTHYVGVVVGLSLAIFALAILKANPAVGLIITTAALPLLGSGDYEARSFNLGVSGLSGSLILLTLWILSLAIIVGGWRSHMYSLGLILILSFSSSHLFWFFVMFELSLVPVFYVVLGGGYSSERHQASLFMFIHTMVSSLPLLWGILLMWVRSGSTYILFSHSGLMSELPSYWPYLFVVGFMVKLPVYGLHLWLPKAHVEAPLGGSMMLAGLLLKVGSYGLYLVVIMLENIGARLELVYCWALMGGVYAGLVCLSQTDLKALIAYTSVSHMSLVVAALLSTNVGSASIIMISHGLTSSALFVFAYSVYCLTGSRSLLLSKGLFSISVPATLLLFVLASFNLGVPPSLNFMGELFAAASLMEWSWVSGIAIFGLVFLGGAYSLYMFSSLAHGSGLQASHAGGFFNAQRFVVMLLHLWPLLLLVLKMGLFI